MSYFLEVVSNLLWDAAAQIIGKVDIQDKLFFGKQNLIREIQKSHENTQVFIFNKVYL